MLEIGVHGNDGGTTRKPEPGHECCLLAKTARQPDAAHAPILLGQLLDNPPRVVRAVVDDDQLEVERLRP